MLTHTTWKHSVNDDDARQEGLLALLESTSVEDRVMGMLRRERHE
jgi:hypothetical protein